MERSDFYGKQEMMTPIGMPFATQEKLVVQSDAHMMGEIIETQVIDQRRYEEFIFSKLTSPKVSDLIAT